MVAVSTLQAAAAERPKLSAACHRNTGKILLIFFWAFSTGAFGIFFCALNKVLPIGSGYH
jgi:hypothetical protein